MKPTAMPIRPAHHRCNTYSKLLFFIHFLLHFKQLERTRVHSNSLEITLILGSTAHKLHTKWQQ